MRTRNKLDSIRTLVETGKISMTLAATRYSERSRVEVQVVLQQHRPRPVRAGV